MVGHGLQASRWISPSGKKVSLITMAARIIWKLLYIVKNPKALGTTTASQLEAIFWNMTKPLSDKSSSRTPGLYRRSRLNCIYRPYSCKYQAIGPWMSNRYGKDIKPVRQASYVTRFDLFYGMLHKKSSILRLISLRSFRNLKNRES